MVIFRIIKIIYIYTDRKIDRRIDIYLLIYVYVQRVCFILSAIGTENHDENGNARSTKISVLFSEIQP